MEEKRFLKLVSSSKKEADEVAHRSDALVRFKGLVLNLTQNALDCLNRISCQEMGKDSPSQDLLEECYLLHHYLDLIKRLCQKKSG